MFPNIGIHHGQVDANVPVAHAEYIFHKIFFSSSTSSSSRRSSADGASTDGGIVKLVVYENLGHVSLLTNKADDIARFAVLS